MLIPKKWDKALSNKKTLKPFAIHLAGTGDHVSYTSYYCCDTIINLLMIY